MIVGCYLNTPRPPQFQSFKRALSLKEMVAYGCPAFSLALLGIAFYVYLPKFYVDVLGVDLSLLGAVILGSRVFDALIDPAIGRWSDSAVSRFGRRLPFLAIGTPLLVGCFWLLLNPGLTVGSEYPLHFFAAFTFIFFILWSLVNVPYEALGAELSFDFNERNRLFSIRIAFFIVGTLLAVVIPEILRTFASSPSESFSLLSLVYVPLVLGPFAWCVYSVRERPAVPQVHGGFLRGLLESLRNKPFRILLISYLISGFGASLPATLIFFFVEHVLGSARGGQFLLLYFVVGFLCSPIWPRVAAQWGKKNAWIASMLINTGAFAGVLALGQGDELWYGVLVGVSGIGLTGTMALPVSMQADVIDLDESECGQRREGQFVGLWSVAKKLSEALGAGLSFPLLAWAGYKGGAAPEGFALTMLVMLYAGVPCVCNLLSILVLRGYTLDRAQHESLRGVQKAE